MGAKWTDSDFDSDEEIVIKKVRLNGTEIGAGDAGRSPHVIIKEVSDSAQEGDEDIIDGETADEVLSGVPEYSTDHVGPDVISINQEGPDSGSEGDEDISGGGTAEEVLGRVPEYSNDNVRIESMIRDYAMRFKVSHVQLSSLQVNLATFLQFVIPKCSKTLLKLPVKPSRPSSVYPGLYLHFYLESALKVVPDSVTKSEKLLLDVFFDGFPLYKLPTKECPPNQKTRMTTLNPLWKRCYCSRTRRLRCLD